MQSIVFFISGHSGVLVSARGNTDRFQAIVQLHAARNQGHDKRGEVHVWMSLITRRSIHEGHEWFSDDSRGRRDFFCLAVLMIM